MTAITVHTQAELDAALNDPDHAFATHEIIIDSPAGVTLVVDDGRGHRVTAYGSSAVIAFGSSSVTAFGSSSVHAYDSSAVRAYGSSTVHAYDSSTVTARDSSTAHAYDSSTVTAYDSSTAHAYGSHVTIAGGVIIDHHKEHQVSPNIAFTDLASIVADAVARQLDVLSIRWTEGAPPEITVASRSDAESLGRVLNGAAGIEHVMDADHHHPIEVWSRNMRGCVLIINSAEMEY